MTIKVGDHVAPKRGSFFHKRGDRFIGKVVRIDPWEEKQLSAENHGTIEIELIQCASYYLSPGELEHFSYYNWYQYLEVVSGE
jgi:hypothetical protein